MAGLCGCFTHGFVDGNITAGVDFMDNAAVRIGDYKLEVKQAMLFAILEGVFSMDTNGTGVATKAAVVLDDIGDSVPYEMSRQAKVNGVRDMIYVRDSYICGVDGVSFEKSASVTASASNDDLKNGANWNIINDETKFIPHKAIALYKIVSKG